MGITTIISSLIIVSSLVWATYNFGIIQFGVVRDYEPHYNYDDIPQWLYNNNFTGGTTDWNDVVNYTDIDLEQSLPNDTLDNLNEPVFVVAPGNPGQLWRTGSYDSYDGDTNVWSKSDLGALGLSTEQLITYGEATNTIYSIFFYATAGATVGAIELPVIFPDIRFIEDSFQTYNFSTGVPVIDVPSRIESYTLETDAYGSLLFTPFILGATGEDVLVSYDISHENQDIPNVISNARNGPFPWYTDPYISNSFTPTTRVINNYTQFSLVGNNVYERAMAVQVYFQSTFNLIIDQAALSDRPSGQETTDWFLERGGGLPTDFATAYCVFMRGLGIPARMVKGYALGELDPLNDLRYIQVRHMQFWAEVFVPMAGGDGEWIQVIPTPLPDEFGGGEIPGNTPIPNIELLIWPTSGQPWAQIGDPFNLSTSLTVEGIPVTTPEVLTIYDELDHVYLGVHTLGDQINYTFPSDATIDYHIISAQWLTATLNVTNTTSVFAVGTPSPMSESEITGEFVLSETRDLNVSQGVDTHITYWEDMIHVYGTMTVGGVPVNSSNYDNKWIQIMWDNTVMGDAFINDYGYYELDIYVDPLDLVEMTVGMHEVWSWYSGDWDGPIPRLNEARSADNSTVTVWGRVGFTLYVSPTAAFRGADVYYDGMIQFLNGSLLPSGQNVGVFFGAQANASRPLNATGGFTWMYTIPLGQAEGTYWARANWSSPGPWQYIAGNWSLSIPVDVESGGTVLTINQVFNPLYVGENITLFGYLTHAANGTGIGGRWVDIFWNNGSLFQLGSALTAFDGYYEFNCTILESDEGPIEYWSYYNASLELTISDSESTHRFTTVKKMDVSLNPIFVTPDPVYILQPVDIEGILQLSEFAFPLANEWVDFWIENSTGIFYIGNAMTNSTGGYLYQYTIPIGQATELVYIWANFTSPYIMVYDGESLHEDLLVEATGTLISIQDDFSFYYVNETILLYGNLQFSNGTPIQLEKVYIHWVNASGTFVYEKFTDALGNYQMLYNCTPTKDDIGIFTVYVNWTSYSVEFDDAFSSLAPDIQLQRYDLEIAVTAPVQLYVDELDFDVQGILTYLGGTPPLAGETVYILIWNGTDWNAIDNPITNSTGGTLSPFTFLTNNEGTVNFAAYYPSSDLLHNNAITYFDIIRVKYAVNLEVTLDFNPIKQNETLTIHVNLYFPHNGSAISNADVDIYWDNGTLTFLGTITTDGTGQGDLFYSGMKFDTVRTGIHVYGDYAGTLLRGANESIHNILTLEQWLTTFVGVNVPLGVYRLTETVVVTGTLEYSPSNDPYNGVTIELTLFGITQEVNVTDGNGDFSISWTIPGSTTPGLYVLRVEFNSPYPWIADASSAVPPISIIAPGYDWPSFNVAPATVYLNNTLTIWGTLTWDNGTPYANSPVDFFWGDPFGVWETIQLNELTDGSGNFYFEYSVPGDTPLGDRQVWAYIDPVGYAAAGMSPTPTITVAIITIDLTTSVDLALVYLNQDVTFSGTLQFTNTTPMVGYDVEIWWDGELLTTITITDPAQGAYNYVHTVPWAHTPGITTGYALFRPPNVSFGSLDILVSFTDVTVMERVDIFLDPEPVDNTVSRGDTLLVTGEVLNDGGFAVESVVVEVLSDGNPTGLTGITNAGGLFTISLDVPLSALGGTYNISVQVVSTYHDLRNGPTPWFIDVYVVSEIDVILNQGSFMPGEGFSIDVQLHNDDGVALDGEFVDIYLGSTFLYNLQLTNADGMTFVIVLPLSWTESGLFTVTAEFAGGPFLDPDSFVSNNTIHVFTDVNFQSLTPSRIDPGQTFSIEVTLVDPNDNPILNRNIRLTIDSDNHPLSTGTDGIISYQMGSYPDGTSIIFTLTVLSSEVTPVSSGEFTINIETTGGNPLQGTDLLIAGILLIGAVVAVLAYLYIVRGMFRSTAGISRGFDVPTKLRNIKKLADAGKYGASITLAYRTFEQMCGTKMGSERRHNETAREYLDRVLQAIPLDLATVEQFVQTYEEARFSHHEMTRERYEEAVRIFTDLYPRIDTAAPME